MRGRKPKPVARQIAAGDPRKKGKGKLQQELATQIKTTKGLPDCPEYLTGHAREAWELWKGELEIMDMDRKADELALVGVCLAYESVRTAYAARDFRTLDKALKTLRSLTSEFGFTPISRQRLSIEAPDTGANDLMKMLSHPRAAKGNRAVQ